MARAELGRRLGLVALWLSAAGQAQGQAYPLGESVELRVAGGYWRPCVITDEGSADRLARARCEPFSRPGGVSYAAIEESFSFENTVDVRKAGTGSSNADLAQQSIFKVGDRVEVKVGGRWRPCVVTDPGTDDSLARARCEAFPTPNYTYPVGEEIFSAKGASDVRTTTLAPDPVAQSSSR